MKKFINKWRQSRIAKLEPCPLPRILTPMENGRVIVFAPHQDDETLGCGGTLALLRKKGCEIKIIFVTDGAGAGGLPEGSAVIRRKEAIAALAAIGVDDLVFLDEPDGNFHNSPEFEQKIMALLHQFRPDWLFLPSVLDYHRDHVATGQAIFSCWSRQKNASRAFFYEIWSPVPATHVVDISSVIELKRQALNQYRLPLLQCDYLSASLGLSRYRALYLPNQGQEQYAEAFVEAENNRYFGGIMSSMLAMRFYLEKLL